MKQVGVIGIGNMGLAMAERLQEGGWAVHVCDIDAARCDQASALGLTVQPTPAAVARALPANGLLVVAVVNAAQCRDVMWGDPTPDGHAWADDAAAVALQAGQTVMWCPTMAPEDVVSLADRLMEQARASHDKLMQV